MNNEIVGYYIKSKGEQDSNQPGVAMLLNEHKGTVRTRGIQALMLPQFTYEDYLTFFRSQFIELLYLLCMTDDSQHLKIKSLLEIECPDGITPIELVSIEGIYIYQEIKDSIERIYTYQEIKDKEGEDAKERERQAQEREQQAQERERQALDLARTERLGRERAEQEAERAKETWVFLKKIEEQKKGNQLRTKANKH